MKDPDYYKRQIAPLPPDSSLSGKIVFGIMPCMCGGARTIRPDKKGRLTAWCDTLGTLERCGRHIGYLYKSDIPDQTFETFEQFDLSILPMPYQYALIEAWKEEGFEISEVTEQPETFEENQDILEVNNNDVPEKAIGELEKPEQSSKERQKRATLI